MTNEKPTLRSIEFSLEYTYKVRVQLFAESVRKFLDAPEYDSDLHQRKWGAYYAVEALVQVMRIVFPNFPHEKVFKNMLNLVCEARKGMIL